LSGFPVAVRRVSVFLDAGSGAEADAGAGAGFLADVAGDRGSTGYFHPRRDELVSGVEWPGIVADCRRCYLLQGDDK
jgi:hypothetical protein